MQLPNTTCKSKQSACTLCLSKTRHHPLVLSWHAAEQALSRPTSQALHDFKMCQSGQACLLLLTDLSRTMCDSIHGVILQGRCLLQHLPIWCCLLPFLPFTPVPFDSCRPCCGPAKPLCCCITPPWQGCSAVCYGRWLRLLLWTLPRQHCNSGTR